MIRRHSPLCAICADRVADTITDWEVRGTTRAIVACWPCLSPVPEPAEEYEPADLAERACEAMSREKLSARSYRGNVSESREAIVVALRSLGTATVGEICHKLQIEDHRGRDVVQQHVGRMVRSGAATATGEVPRRYTLVGDRKESLRQLIAGVESPFVASAVGLGRSAVSELRRAGLIRQASKRAGRVRMWEVA